MKYKKISAFALSAIIMSFSFPAQANAEYQTDEFDLSKYEEIYDIGISGNIDVPEFNHNVVMGRKNQLYIREYSDAEIAYTTFSHEVIYKTNNLDAFYVQFHDKKALNEDDFKIINETISNISTYAKIDYSTEKDDNGKIFADMIYVDDISSISDGKKIINEIMALYPDGKYTYLHNRTKYYVYMLEKSENTGWLNYDKQDEEKIKSFIEKNYPKYEIRECKNQVGSYICLVPDKELNIKENIAISCEIKNSTGCTMINWVTSEEPKIMNLVIDYNNFIDGDANEDGHTSISDSVAILQNLANSEKYPLSPQGKYNADCDGSDGITGLDAAYIQQLDAGAISSIPETLN